MNTIIIPAAESIADQRPAPITIIIDDKYPLPKFNSIKQAVDYYDEQAEAIVDGLFNSLPQGIFDRIAIKIMAKKVSLYKGLTK
jgi:hypothetical protein